MKEGLINQRYAQETQDLYLPRGEVVVNVSGLSTEERCGSYRQYIVCIYQFTNIDRVERVNVSSTMPVACISKQHRPSDLTTPRIALCGMHSRHVTGHRWSASRPSQIPAALVPRAEPGGSSRCVGCDIMMQARRSDSCFSRLSNSSPSLPCGVFQLANDIS